MPSRKSMEQATTWLKSKAADRNSLDGINAELCLHVIEDLQRQIRSKGWVISQMKRQPGGDILHEPQTTFIQEDLYDD